MIMWNCLGDSITDDIYVPRHYYTYILERNEQVMMRNYGIAGTRIGGRRTCGEDNKMMCRRYKEMKPADLITVWGGVNDWGQRHPTPLGKVDDRTDETFYGALRILCEGLQSQFPMSHIVFITPIGNDGYEGMPIYENEFGLTVFNYADAILSICKEYNIPVIDLARTCGFTPHDQIQNKLYFIDGLHLSVAGHEKISHVIEQGIKQYFI